MNKLNLAATVLLATLVLSVFTPVIVNATEAVMPAFATMHEDEDVFSGGFSAKKSIEPANEGVRGDVETYGSNAKHISSCYFGAASPNTVLHSRKGSLPRQASSSSIGVSVNVESSRASSETSVEPLANTIRILGQVKFVNETGGLSLGRFMRVEMWDFDTGGEGSQLAWGWTDAEGFFDITGANQEADGEDPFVRVVAQGRWDWIAKNSSGSTHRWRFPASGAFRYNLPPSNSWIFPVGPLEVVLTPEVLQAGDAVYQEAQWVRDRVGWSRPPVTIVYPVSDPIAHCHGDQIDLPGPINWDHFTLHHEEGHAIMYSLYGHLPAGSGVHNIFDESNEGQAMSEGFAALMQCAVTNDVANSFNFWNGHGGDIEDNDWFNCIDTGDMDGGIVEGSAASILWDIFDPKSPSDNDYMFWDFDDMFWVLRDFKPDSMDQFWFGWLLKYPDLATNMGPLSSIYWHYGIDKDFYSPTGTITINSGAPYTGSTYVTLSLIGNDWGSGVESMRFSQDGGATWESGWRVYTPTKGFVISNQDDGWKRIDVQFMDYKGHVSEAGTIYDGITLDMTPPSGSIMINSGNPTYTKTTSVTLYLTYTDELSGVDKVRYSNDGTWDTEPWENPAITKAWTLASSPDGTRTVRYQIMDHAGVISTTYTDTIILDTVAPTTTVVLTAGSSVVSLSAVDSTSGVKATYYRIDSASWTTYLGPFILFGAGSRTIECYSQDNALNSETVKIQVIHWLRVNSDPLPITSITGTGWYKLGTTAFPGVAPAIVFYNGTTYYFSTWKVDGSPVYGNPIQVTMNAPHTATAYYTTTRSVTIRAHCNTESLDVSVGITQDESPSGYNTPHTFSLSGTHTFTVPATDAAGHPFKQWTNGVTSRTITITTTGAGTFTAIYEQPDSAPTFEIWTDKTTYTVGETMTVYVKVVNPCLKMPVRATIKLGLPGGGTYGPLLDLTTTLPPGFSSGTVTWNAFVIPAAPAGTYSWIAELRNPTTNALIDTDTWTWTLI